MISCSEVALDCQYSRIFIQSQLAEHCMAGLAAVAYKWLYLCKLLLAYVYKLYCSCSLRIVGNW